MTFSQIPYVRADLAAWKQQQEDITARFRAAQTFEEADAIYREAATFDADYTSMMTIARIRNNIDTRDEFYDAEVAYYNQEMPKMQAVSKAWTEATLESPFRPQLEEKYGKVTFINAEMAAKAFSPELVAEMQQENALRTRYSKLIASAQIPFDGKTCTISQMEPHKLSTDDDLRRAAWKAEGKWFKANGKELDAIYDELVALRHGMALKLGHKSYTPLGYDRMQRNCYTEQDVEQFRIAVQTYVVPLCKRIYMNQAQRMGFEFPLSFADKDLAFRSGNPKPVGTPADILAAGTRFYSELSPETREFWNGMMTGEMMDVQSRPGKAMGGYCTGIYAAKSPFIFANFNGTAHDVKVITHEAGHAFAFYVNRDRVPSESMTPSLEGCEVHSMAMEFFAEDWAEDFFGADADKFRYTHLSERLCFIPYGTMVDHFQHVIYEYPEFGPKERHMVWQELMGLYMPWLRPDDIPFYGEGKAWQRQAHIYKRPFYYIDYCLAQTVALQFWAMLREDRAAAWKTYMDYTKLGGSMVFTDLLATAGLRSPFDPECLKEIAAKAKDYLDKFDLTGIE